MSNPAIRPRSNGDVDIAVPDDKVDELSNGSTEPEPGVDPHNLDHPEELMGG